LILDVELENPLTWPADFQADMLAGRALILAYQRERSRIDQICQEDIISRLNPPENRYENDYKSLLQRLDTSLRKHRIVAYHCTRLLPEEIAEITSVGLRVLSRSLAQGRVKQAVAAGHLSRDDADRLTASETMARNLDDRSGKRTGMICFCPNRSSLADASGVYRLFRSWGGEVVYCGLEDDVDMGPLLGALGMPCIVKCALHFEHARQFHASFAARFVSLFISDEIESPAPSASFDLYTTQNVNSSSVVEVIAFSDPRFASMTRYPEWSDCHRMDPRSDRG
jgi:hypothetical protein